MGRKAAENENVRSTPSTNAVPRKVCKSDGKKKDQSGERGRPEGQREVKGQR